MQRNRATCVKHVEELPGLRQRSEFGQSKIARSDLQRNRAPEAEHDEGLPGLGQCVARNRAIMKRRVNGNEIKSINYHEDFNEKIREKKQKRNARDA